MKTYLVYDKSHEDVLREEDCNLMLTFASIPKGENRWFPHGFKSIMVDSGGYQLQTGIKPSRDLTITAYTSWLQFALEEYSEIVDGYLNLDIMNDTDQTLKNLAYMEGEGLHPIPVWHPGEGDWMLEYYCSEYSYVALGGLVGKGKMGRFVIRDIFQRMKINHPNTRFHILGMGITASSALRSFRPYSVDYSTWVNVYKFGHGLIWDKDGLLREQPLPKETRDRIRVDREFKREMVRDAIKKIKIYGERIEGMSDPYQLQFPIRT